MINNKKLDVSKYSEKKLTSRAIIIKNNKILLMYRFKHGKEYYTLIGGKLKKNETPEDAMIREVKEETNLTISNFEKVFEFEDDKRYTYYYLAKEFNGQAILGGPENVRNSFENRYILEWIDFKQFDKINLMNLPELKNKIKEYLK